MERLKTYVLGHGFSVKEFSAVAANNNYDLYDFYRRIKAVNNFCKLKSSESLAAANKRVSNILSGQSEELVNLQIDKNLLLEKEEINLSNLVIDKIKLTKKLLEDGDYEKLLVDLAGLREAIDEFFDHVMVMVDDERIRKNRLILLAKLRALFLQVADISFL